MRKIIRDENDGIFQEISVTEEFSFDVKGTKPPNNSPEESSIPFMDDSPQREYFSDCHYKKKRCIWVKHDNVKTYKDVTKTVYCETHF